MCAIAHSVRGRALRKPCGADDLAIGALAVISKVFGRLFRALINDPIKMSDLLRRSDHARNGKSEVKRLRPHTDSDTYRV
jgi:hypothetical protein